MDWLFQYSTRSQTIFEQCFVIILYKFQAFCLKDHYDHDGYLRQELGLNCPWMSFVSQPKYTLYPTGATIEWVSQGTLIKEGQ